MQYQRAFEFIPVKIFLQRGMCGMQIGFKQQQPLVAVARQASDAGDIAIHIRREGDCYGIPILATQIRRSLTPQPGAARALLSVVGMAFVRGPPI